mgnify:CR=1 FL=1
MDNNEEFMNATEGTSEEYVTSTANNNDFYTDNEASNYDNTVYGDYDYTPEKKNPVGLLSMIFGFEGLFCVRSILNPEDRNPVPQRFPFYSGAGR